MAIAISCVIKISEIKYEDDSKDIEILSEMGHVTYTGNFRSSTAEILKEFVESVIEQAKDKTDEKLDILK